MYLSFYNLDKQPFQISTDPEFLWLGTKHKEALSVLKYGIRDNKGFLLLTGDVGTGKTTLINGLVSDLGDEVIVARVPDPGMTGIDFMNFLSHVFAMGRRFKHKDTFLAHFSDFLNTSHDQQKKVVLIIDESQRLSPGLLEEVRQLSNIERPETKLLNIFLIGQNEFNDLLEEPRNRALRQRIAINYSLSPLDLHETGELIVHRLKVAGAKTQIFNSEAICRIFDFTGGIPRKINILCDHCLIAGYVANKHIITANMVRTCIKEFNLSTTQQIPDRKTLCTHVKDAPFPNIAHVPEVEVIPVEQGLVSEPGGSSERYAHQRFGRVFALALVLAAIGYGLSQPGSKETVFRLAGSGVQVAHVAYLSSLDFIRKSRVGSSMDVSALVEEDVAVIPSSVEVKSVNQGAPAFSVSLASFSTIDNVPEQLPEEVKVMATISLEESVLPTQKEEYSPPVTNAVWVTLPEHFVATGNVAGGMPFWGKVTGIHDMSDLPVIFTSTSETPVEAVYYYIKADTVSPEPIVRIVQPTADEEHGLSVAIDQQVELTRESSLNEDIVTPSRPIVAEGTTLTLLSQEKPEEDVAEVFQRMDEHFSELDMKNEEKEDMQARNEKVEPIDSGKVIDWLLSTH